MTKFEELCGACVVSRQKFINYRDECSDFAVRVVNKLEDYFGMSNPNLVSYVPLDKEPEERLTYTVSAAIHLNEDSYWHFGVMLKFYDLSHDDNINMSDLIKLKIKIKKVDNHFVLKFGDKHEKFLIERDEDLIPFYDLVYREIKDYFDNNLEKFLNGEKPSLGFLDLG